MNIIVVITDKDHSYSERMDNKDMLEYYCEIVGNQSNPYMYNVSFYHWVREIDCKINDIKKYNTGDENCHFIFGWIEGFLQSSYIPKWMIDNYNDLKIEVIQTS